MATATLALEDGTVLRGQSFGADGEVCAEVVFNTSLTGYQEIITDASYSGQMIAFTCSHIGNVGVNAYDYESARAQCAAVIAREIEPVPSNWRAALSLPVWLQQQNVVAIGGVDTRALTTCLRERGVMKGVVSTLDVTADRLVEKARAWEGLDGRDLVREVTCDEIYAWTEGTLNGFEPFASGGRPRSEGLGSKSAARHPHVVVYDFGVKRNILRRLVSRGCRVSVVPASTTAAEALELLPDGILLSNGPGDPAALAYAVDAVRGLLQTNKPLFGVCLGHQLLGQALGGRTYKLKFGHHGGNHPVQHLASGRIAISAQNHNYGLDGETLDAASIEITHRSLNDGCVEGLRLKDRPVFGVQYHPESSPGPHDSDDLFGEFVALLRGS
jgi:carbamoyl-phosphate synthase small subunit